MKKAKGLCPLDPHQRQAFGILPLGLGDNDGPTRTWQGPGLPILNPPNKVEGSKGLPLAGSRGRALAFLPSPDSPASEAFPKSQP